jgi:GTPase SAR1 family protein
LKTTKLTCIGSDKDRFEENKEEFQKLLKDERLIYVPVCVMANKQDKKDAIDDEQVIEVLFEDY